VDWFSDYATLNPSPEKASIALEDLLTMRSGLSVAEDLPDPSSAADPARAMLARDVTDTPVGTVWNYSTGGTEIIAEILRIATKSTPEEYANRMLFGPIGSVEPPWEAGASGTSHGGVGLSLTAREMARFGELYRNLGVWQDQQVVPRDWTATSTFAHCATLWGMDYGYLWFVPKLADFFVAIGMYGQQIFVSRSTGLVIVFTGNLPSSDANIDYSGIINDFVLPAIP
jgi:CubicO group peptidase (beta-lactamase class C family)